MTINAFSQRPDAGPDTTEDEARWAALLRRDRAFDGTFFYSVASTGIYCVPSCASRTPLRQNVRFHATVEDAERAGFRPCKRCRPGQAPLRERHAEKIAQACRLIEGADSEPTLGMLAEQVAMSPHHFHRLFKSIVGVTPKAYAVANRHHRVRQTLADSGSVTDAIYASGFNSSGRFYAASADMLGMTPRDFRAGGAAIEIRFAVGESSLGLVLVAASGKGVCTIMLGDTPEPLRDALKAQYPRAHLIEDDPGFNEIATAVIGFVDSPGKGLTLPLDIHGTAFQQRVWDALRKIPLGRTATYADIAAAIGAPKAVRAVARACASNRLAVAIPCHRVVRTDGSLSGYRWGVARKRKLLDREAKG